MRSAVRDIARHEKSLADCQKKIGDIEKKIAAKQKDLGKAEAKLSQAQTRELNARHENLEERADFHDGVLSEVSMTLHDHEQRIRKLSELPEEIAVLFFAANPLDQTSIRLDEEVRLVTEMIRKSEHRDAVRLVSRWAVRPMDILQAINEHKPTIIHFSGHGSDMDEIVFQDDDGNSKFVSKDAIVQTMMATGGDIRLVFFNTCYSANQAESVVKHVESAVGMKTAIGDDAARVFASQFYSAIGFGLSVATSFNQAKALLMLEGIPEEDIPQLFVMDGINADELVIVRPPATPTGSS